MSKNWNREWRKIDHGRQECARCGAHLMRWEKMIGFAYCNPCRKGMGQDIDVDIHRAVYEGVLVPKGRKGVQ